MIRSKFLSTTCIGLAAISFSALAIADGSGSCLVKVQNEQTLAYVIESVDGQYQSADTTCVADAAALLEGSSCVIALMPGETAQLQVRPEGVAKSFSESQTISMTCNSDVTSTVNGSIVYTGVAYSSYTSACPAVTGITYSGCGKVSM